MKEFFEEVIQTIEQHETGVHIALFAVSGTCALISIAAWMSKKKPCKEETKNG